MKILPVPFVSQLQQGALEHNNDCGAACDLMIMRAYNVGKTLTVDSLYNSIQPTGDAYLSATGMMGALTSVGITSDWRPGIRLQDLYAFLSDKKPMITLINYGALVDAGYTQKKTFRGAHFVVVVGMDIEEITIRDPYRDDVAETVIPLKTFNAAWSSCALNGNPNNGAIVPRIAIKDLSGNTPTGNYVYKFKPDVWAVNIRSSPLVVTNPDNRVGAITNNPPGVLVYVSEVNSSNWGLLADRRGWISLAFFNRQ